MQHYSKEIFRKVIELLKSSLTDYYYKMKLRIETLTPMFCVSIFLSVALASCKQEIIRQTYISPSIQILSAEPTTLSTFQLITKLEAGEGQKIKEIKIVFDDITVLTEPDISKKIKYEGEKVQLDTLDLNFGSMNHDYNVTAYIITDQYTYESQNVLMRSSKNQFSFDIYSQHSFRDFKDIPEALTSAGENFLIKANYLNKIIPNTIEVKLKRELVLEHDFNFEHYSVNGNFETDARVKLPEEIEPGIYDVYIYIDSIEFQANNKLKVLDGRWTEVYHNYEGELSQKFAWFANKSSLFLIGSKFPEMAMFKFPVWQYDIIDGSWTKKKDFPLQYADGYNNKIFDFNLEYNNDAYVIVRQMDKIEVWKYLFANDSWNLVTTYPGSNTYGVVSFVTNNSLYIGNGQASNKNTNDYHLLGSELWKFNLISSEWEQMHDLPFAIEINSNGILSYSTLSGDVYAFNYSNEFWFYEASSDTWSKKAKFPGPKRLYTNITEANNKLYLTGGYYYESGFGDIGLKDCWEYSIESDTWKLIAFLPEKYGNGISFTYDNQVYCGMGIVENGFNNYIVQNFFRLDF